MFEANELEVGYTTVGHEEPGREIGLSNVSLPTRMPFIDICEELSLEHDTVGGDNTLRHVWHNADVLLVTERNPIERGGVVGNLGIEGDKRVVYRVFGIFTTHASYDEISFKERKFV